MRSVSKLTEFMEGGQEKQETPKMELDVDVCCQICGEYVDGANYHPVEKLLTWRCSQGHTSFIEEFRL